MESFTVQCTSCQSRIRVRNPKMIGQIANCPKCNSMIMITAPQQITVESGNVTDSVAVTREALPTPDPQAFENFDNISFDQGFRSDGLPESPSDSLRNAGFGDLDDDLPRLAPESVVNVPSGTWSPIPPPRTGEQVASAAAALQAKRLQAINKQRQVLFIAAIGLCSVLVAAGGLFLFLRMFRTTKPVAQNNSTQSTTTTNGANSNATQPNNQTPTQPSTGDANPATAPTPPVDPIDTPPNPDAQAGPTTTNTATNTAGTAEGSNLATTSVDPNATNPNATNPNATNPDNPSTTANSTAPAASSTGAPIGAPLASSVAPSIDSVFAGPDPASPPTATASTDLPPGLASFATIFGQSLEPALPDATVPLDKASVVPEEASVKNGAAVAPQAVLPQDVDKRLKLEMRGLRIDKRPLSDAIIALASAGDFPIIADLDALAIGGYAVNPIIDFTSTEPILIGSAIQKISAASGLSFDSLDNQALIVRPTSAWINDHVPASLPIGDLVTSTEESDALVAALRALLPELTGTIQVDGGSLTLALDDQNRMAWYQIARLLERWRAERGISNDQSAKVVPESSRTPKWPTEIQKQLSSTKIKYFLPAEPLVRSWQRLCGEAGVVCWVDWVGLKLSDVTPTQIGSVITLGRPMNDVLRAYADKYDIVFAIENDQSLWITSKTMHRLQPRLYVLPLGDKTIEQWREELEPLSPIDPVTGGVQLILIPTPDGKHFFTRCCRPTL